MEWGSEHRPTAERSPSSDSCRGLRRGGIDVCRPSCRGHGFDLSATVAVRASNRQARQGRYRAGAQKAVEASRSSPKPLCLWPAERSASDLVRASAARLPGRRHRAIKLASAWASDLGVSAQFDPRLSESGRLEPSTASTGLSSRRPRTADRVGGDPPCSRDTTIRASAHAWLTSSSGLDRQAERELRL